MNPKTQQMIISHRDSIPVTINLQNLQGAESLLKPRVEDLSGPLDGIT